MAATKGADRWKAKKWYSIYAPEILGSGVIGDMPANDDKAIIGRVINVSMSWITNKMSHSFLTVGLKVVGVNGNAANTQLKCLEQTYSYLHSLVKRRSSIIYTVSDIKDSEGKPLVLKLVAITFNKATSPKKTALRKELGLFTQWYVSSRSREQLIKDVIDGAFQTEGIKRVRNIAVLNKLEVKKIELG